MIKRLLIGLAFLSSQTLAFGQNSAVEELTERVNAMTLIAQPKDPLLVRDFIEISERGDYVDMMIKELFLYVDLPQDMLDAYVENFSLKSGQWTDLDYTNANRSGWIPGYHSMRLYSLARAYKSPDSKHYNSPALRRIILRGIDFWSEAKLICPNWWYNQIGVPKLMAPVYLLMKPEMSEAQIRGAVGVLSRAKFGMTGQNKVALAAVVLMRALLERDLQTVLAAKEQIASEIYFTDKGEGLQRDYSFHQHGPMMQMGNYGLAYIATMAHWGRIFEGTSLAFNEEQVSILSNYALQCMRWVVWRGEMDIASCGRQLFVNSARGKSHALCLAMNNMAVLDSANSRMYLDFVADNQLNPKGKNRLVGSKFYPKSDYLLHRTPTWYGSVRMSSNRTYGFEMTNSENLQGWFSADGVTYISHHGREYENIFPLWNWRELPGLTCRDDGGELPTRYNFFSNKSDFVGGVAADGLSVAAMELDRDGLQARKAYFFLENMMVCLGSGITSAHTLPTTTSIEQSLLRGEVNYGVGSKRYRLDQGDSISSENLSWVHQNSIGYLMLSPMKVSLSARTTSGNWGRIAKFYENRPDVQDDIFKIVISHGSTPHNEGYAYAVLPGLTAQETATAARKLRVNIISNDKHCQGVASVDGRSFMLVFYEPGQIKSKELHFKAIEKGIYVVRKNKDDYRVDHWNNGKVQSDSSMTTTPRFQIL